MADKKLIVIVGITGNQGASVADAFIDEPGWKIRGISRDPSKASSKVWSDKGVEMVAGDLDNLESLQTAFKGANVIFGVTDFWQAIGNPKNHQKAAERGVTINEVAYEIEVQQGKNIVDAAAMTLNTLDRFVLSTLSHAKKWSGGKTQWNLHFDAKWAAVDYLKETYPELLKKTSLLQVALFMTNWQSGGAMAPQKQADGTYILSLPTKAHAKLPMVNPRVDVGPLTKALVQAEPGKNLLGAASVLSWTEWCELWGKKHGVTCRYEECPPEKLDEAMPGGVGKELADMFVYFSDPGYDGGDPSVILPKDLGVDVELQSIQEYIDQTDFSSIL
ncbi:hypothetical protein H2201_002871 [Coniosporium apollinis]|uniref:NmrA-like domain-containing protein n=1 Tax=Coniosporium apollinis TaxID=61459 RepID=A0ABQ9NXC7_9PEZI|nr:hypothetical protein H2201_002871 [Coniosporium apollinis]